MSSKVRKKKQLQFIGIQYFRKTKEEDDLILLTVRDRETGEKHLKTVRDPKITYYINKDEYWTDLPVSFIEPHKVEERTSLYRELFKDMAYELGEQALEFYKECLESGRYHYLNKLHLDANVHGSDIDIRDYYISKFMTAYPQDEGYKPTKAYFDIEVDSMHHEGFPDEHDAPCPINAITVYFHEYQRSYTLLLIQEDNEQMMNFMNNRAEGFLGDLHQEFIDKHKLDIDFNMEFYEDELEMIERFFQLVNEYKPDFMLAWNIQFDILTLMNRVKKLYDGPVEDIFCPPEAPRAEVYFYEDNRNQDPADKGSHFTCTGYTNWVDQMLLFASLRKTFGKRESYSLDAIAYEELKERKDPIPNGVNMKNFAWKAYEQFVHYNIVDVILLHLIEEKNEDIDMIYGIALMTQTRIDKALKKTVSLTNLARKFAREQGWIMSNNRNRRFGDSRGTSEKFRGAFVADPLLNLPTGLEINGRKSKFVFENVIDFDLSSLYPSIILAFNVDASTQFGKLILPEDPDDDNSEDIAYQFYDSLASRDSIAIGERWFNLPSPEEVIEKIHSKLQE